VGSFLSFAVVVLVAAMALNWAAHLLLEVWQVLVVVLAIGALITGVSSLIRRRYRGW